MERRRRNQAVIRYTRWIGFHEHAHVQAPIETLVCLVEVTCNH